MKFRSELNIDKLSHSITHDSKILALGSCFVDNVGEKLSALKFDITINPFGIIFNPYSIAKILNQGLEEPIELESASEFMLQKESYKSFDFHSKFHSKSHDDFKAKVNSTHQAIKHQLHSASDLMLTFGTAWVYRHLDSNKIVANCQKEPQTQFKKEQLELSELVKIYTLLFNHLFKQNPNLKITLTVSPVRHLKDGIVENNQSKAILLLLCSKLAKRFSKQVIYFPSYDIQMDDLRDYRFYNSDLVHPNQMAIDYIFEKFSNAYFTDKTMQLNSKIEKLNKLENHQFLNATDAEKEKHQQKINQLKRELDLIRS